MRERDTLQWYNISGSRQQMESFCCLEDLQNDINVEEFFLFALQKDTHWPVSTRRQQIMGMSSLASGAPFVLRPLLEVFFSRVDRVVCVLSNQYLAD